MKGDASDRERIRRLEREKQGVELRIEGLLRDQARQENILDGQRTLLKRINEEYREALERIEEQNRELVLLTDGLEERVRQRTRRLEQANALLRDLPARILRAQERERKLVAHDLHDSIVQSIGALKLFIEDETAQLEPLLPDHDFGRMRSLAGTAGTILEELRRIMSHLRPSVIDDYGLKASLEWLVRSHGRESPDMPVRSRLEFVESAVHDDLKTVVFRITQEGLSNARKHSGAGRVVLEVRREGRTLAYRLEDDGRGFEPGLPNRSGLAGYGLESMHERAALAGGDLRIESRPGGPTAILATFSLEQSCAYAPPEGGQGEAAS